MEAAPAYGRGLPKAIIKIQSDWNAMVDWCMEMHFAGFELTRGTVEDEIAWVEWLMAHPITTPRWRR